jgi:hypothetical protein
VATTSRGATGAARFSMMPADGDTQTRFLREMALRLPLDRVVEAHVFPPIRQGGAETGVAVIAVKREDAASGEREAVSASEGVEAESATAVDLAAAADARGGPPHGKVANDSGAEPHHADAAASDSSPVEQEAVVGAEQAEGAPATEAPPNATPAGDGQANGTNGDDALIASRFPLPASPLPDRYTVFSARYRLTLKGPDRGKWEVDVVEEADAPLVTVGAVVRGVQRRGGEGADAERFTAEQLRALLEEPAAP